MNTKDPLLTSDSKPSRHFFSKKQKQIAGGLIFVIGVLISFTFNSLAILADLNGVGFWGDFQDALEFNHEQATQANLVNIRCPIFLAPGEDGTLSATFRNPHANKADISVKAVVSESDYVNYRAVKGGLTIDPGDKQDFRWQVTGKDVIANNFILSRIFLMNQYNSPYPARTASCGIFVLSLFGLKGNTLVALMVAASFIGMVVGSFLLFRKHTPARESFPRIEYGRYGVAGTLIISMASNLLGWWIVAGLVLLLAALLTIILILNLPFIKG